MTAKAILAEIKPLGRDSYKKVLLNHGVKEPCFGVKVEDLKKIQRRIKMDYRLALDLYDTGVSPRSTFRGSRLQRARSLVKKQ